MVLNKELILTIVLIILIIGFAGLFFFKQINNEIVISEAINLSENSKRETGEEINMNNDAEGLVINKFADQGKNMGGNTVVLLEEKIIVHVAGEVRFPGVYELKERDRVIDAVVAAGGETQLADLDVLNLAAPIYDGEKVYIPSILETAMQSEVSNYKGVENQYSGQREERNKLININRATVEELTQLPGIGPAKANSIVEHRKKIGNFGSKEELLEVSGIGEKTLANIQDQISVR